MDARLRRELDTARRDRAIRLLDEVELLGQGGSRLATSRRDR